MAPGSGYSKAIVDVMCETGSLAFGGFGRHLANDFCYTIALYPGTPVHALCNSDVLYLAFKAAIPLYMQQWRDKEFLRKCAGQSNSDNPFAFNVTSNKNYLSSYIHVFRKERVRVPADLYNLYQSQGLLDASHTIGVSNFYIYIR